MIHTTWVRGVVGIALFGAGVLTGLVAQTNSDVPQRVEQRRADLSGAPNMEVIASVLEFKPGDTGALHVHHGIEAAYVLQDATLQMQGQPAPTVMKAGSTVFNLRDVKHGGFKVMGDASFKIFAVHVVDKGKPLYDFSK